MTIKRKQVLNEVLEQLARTVHYLLDYDSEGRQKKSQVLDS